MKRVFADIVYWCAKARIGITGRKPMIQYFLSGWPTNMDFFLISRYSQKRAGL